MTYATYISQLRTQTGDTARPVHVDFTGDGSTKIFPMPVDTYPILEDSYTVKVDSVAQTETTHYTLDKEAGTITFVTAPTNGYAVTMDCSAVNLIDDTWLNIINDVIYSLGNDFFKETLDITSFTTTAYMTSLDLSALDLIAVCETWVRDSSSSEWQLIRSFANQRYDREDNKLYFGSREAFTETGKEIKLLGLLKYTIGTATSDTIDVQDRFLTIIEYGALARYYRYRYKSVIELVSKMTTEQTRTPLQELIMLSDRFDRSYEIEKRKLKPKKPTTHLSTYKEGLGRP